MIINIFEEYYKLPFVKFSLAMLLNNLYLNLILKEIGNQDIFLTNKLWKPLQIPYNQAFICNF